MRTSSWAYPYISSPGRQRASLLAGRPKLWRSCRSLLRVNWDFRDCNDGKVNLDTSWSSFYTFPGCTWPDPPDENLLSPAQDTGLQCTLCHKTIFRTSWGFTWTKNSCQAEELGSCETHRGGPGYSYDRWREPSFSKYARKAKRSHTFTLVASPRSYLFQQEGSFQ